MNNTRNDQRREQRSAYRDDNGRTARYSDSAADNYPAGSRRSTQTIQNIEVKSGGIAANKKAIIIGLGAIAAIALAIGIGTMISNAGKVRIISVQPATLPAQVPYQSCQQVGTTSYSRNQKNGTEGAIIGGVGGAAVGGLITHSWVGAGVGAAVGAVGGDLIQRSNQPDYVAHHGSKTECQTLYKAIQVPIGYQVQYMNNDDTTAQIITQHQPPVGDKIPLQQLEADQVTPVQQQQMVQQAINGGGNTAPAAAPAPAPASN